MDVGGEVRRRYGAIAARALQRSRREGGAAVQVSLGCGDPVSLAGLGPGNVVLDLGSGGGRDCLLAARRVAPGGRVYGLDMTEEMIALAARNLKGTAGVELVRGEIERIPLRDGTVDVVIYNCVINLSVDKCRVLAGLSASWRPAGGWLPVISSPGATSPRGSARGWAAGWGASEGRSRSGNTPARSPKPVSSGSRWR